MVWLAQHPFRRFKPLLNLFACGLLPWDNSARSGCRLLRPILPAQYDLGRASAISVKLFEISHTVEKTLRDLSA